MNGIQVPKRIDVKKLRDAEPKKRVQQKNVQKMLILLNLGKLSELVCMKLALKHLGSIIKHIAIDLTIIMLKFKNYYRKTMSFIKSSLVLSQQTMFLSRKLSLSSIVLWYKESCI